MKKKIQNKINKLRCAYGNRNSFMVLERSTTHLKKRLDAWFRKSCSSLSFTFIAFSRFIRRLDLQWVEKHATKT